MRLPPLTELTPRQQEVSDKIAAKRGATRGPFLIWLRSPELAEKVDALGAYCRFDSGLNERLRELSLLIAPRPARPATSAPSTRGPPTTRRRSRPASPPSHSKSSRATRYRTSRTRTSS